MSRGRKSTYSAKVAVAICERLAAGESLRRICRDEGMPSRATVFSWTLQNAEFQGQYARARDFQAFGWADEILDLADDQTVDVQRLKLQVDTRKWILARMLPKLYGDKVPVHAERPKQLEDKSPKEDDGQDLGAALREWSAANGVGRRRHEEEAPPKPPMNRPGDAAQEETLVDVLDRYRGRGVQRDDE
jgi:hypothetical protein